MLKSILLTLSLCVTLITVLSALASPDSSEVDSFVRPALPQEIVDAEAEYEVQQQAIEGEILRLTLGTLELSPEERRATMLTGMEALRPGLLEQQASSNAIDALYEDHQVPLQPGPLEMLAAQAPKDPEAAALPQGQRWALDYDLARLRQDFAGDPERLRVAMIRWNAENADAFQKLVEGDSVVTESTDERFATRPPIAPLETPAGATENVRCLVSLLNELADISAEYPPPVAGADSSTLTLQEMEEWRDAAGGASAALLGRLSPILNDFDQENNRRLARQYSDENTH